MIFPFFGLILISSSRRVVLFCVVVDIEILEEATWLAGVSFISERIHGLLKSI